MKKYNRLLDLLLLSGLMALALVAIAPKTIVMPTSIQMIILAVVLALISLFLVMFWREEPNDERELQNQAIASRSAYFVGSLVLIVALIIQSLAHTLDPIVPITLLSMIGTKIIVQRYKDES